MSEHDVVVVEQTIHDGRVCVRRNGLILISVSFYSWWINLRRSLLGKRWRRIVTTSRSYGERGLVCKFINNNFLLTRVVPVSINSTYGRAQLENALIDFQSRSVENSTATTMPANLLSDDVPLTGGSTSDAATTLGSVPVVILILCSGCTHKESKLTNLSSAV